MHDEETYHLKPAQQVKRLARESKRLASEKWQSVISPSLWFSGKPTQCMCMNTPNNLSGLLVCKLYDQFFKAGKTFHIVL